MKYIAAFVAFLFLSASLYAKCASSGIWVTGNNRLVFNKAIIVLEFYESSQLIAGKLNKDYPIYLESGNEKIPLQIKEILTGGYRITQVIAVLTQSPAEGRNYKLVIDRLKKDDAKPEQYNYDTHRNEPYTFTGAKEPLLSTPFFTTIPVETKKVMASYGCGPARWIYYSPGECDKPVSYILTSLKDKTTGLVTNFILAPEKDGSIKVGHGMCSGGFGFTEGHAYEISFSLMDLAGNKSEKTTVQPVVPPFKETGEED